MPRGIDCYLALFHFEQNETVWEKSEEGYANWDFAKSSPFQSFVCLHWGLDPDMKKPFEPKSSFLLSVNV